MLISFFYSLFIQMFLIAGLSYNTDEMGLRDAFAKYGDVVEGTSFLAQYMIFVVNCFALSQVL